MKKVISLFLSVAMLLSIVSVVDFSAFADVQTGSCGDNVTYSLDTSTGVLTISGTGEMTDSPFRQNFNFNIIKSVIIKNGVTSISDYAFADCSSLASVTIPNSVTNIGDGAFKWSGITNITIPDSVTSIGDGAFEWSGITNITIPDSVTNIGICTFFFCKKLNFVSIPNSVTSIGSEAFYGTSLTSIKIPDSVTSIGDSAFAGCENLKNIAIGSGVLSIGEKAFSGTGYYNDKSNWNNGTLYISDCLIDIDNDFNSIDDYTIKENTRVIADQAFFDCANLSSINVSNNNKNYSSNDGVLFNKDKTELITYPAGKTDSEYVIPNSVTSIGYSAFENCTSLTSVTIPNSVKSLGDNAFGSVKKVIYNGTDKEFFEIKNIENNKNVIVAKYNDLLNDLISEIEVPYKQSEYLKITDDYLYNTIKDRINNNEDARNKKISIKNGEFYINGMDIGELEVQYVYFPQHYDDLNGNIESLHKVYCYIYDESSGSSYLDVKVKFINDSDYNKADEKYVSDFIKTLNIAKPQCYEVDYEEYKTGKAGSWKYYDSVASEYYNKLINDSSIKFVAGSGAGECIGFLNPCFCEAGVDLAVFKNDVLYGTYYPITNYKDGVNITDEKIIPVMTLPSDLPDNQVENYILQKLKNDWENESYTILSVKKGAVVNGSQLKDGYVIKIAPGYYEGDYGIIIARKQNNSTSDEKPTPVPTPSPAQQVTQPTAHNDTATTLQAKNTVSKPKSTNTKKIKAAKKAISVTWKKVSGVKGYQIQVATDKKFKKNKKTVTIKKQKTTKTTVKKLKAKKKYYVRIRTYKIVNGKKVYSSWSKVKSVKTK